MARTDWDSQVEQCREIIKAAKRQAAKTGETQHVFQYDSGAYGSMSATTRDKLLIGDVACKIKVRKWIGTYSSA